MKHLICISFLFVVTASFAVANIPQNETAVLKGRAVNKEQQGVSFMDVAILFGKEKVLYLGLTQDDGTFTIPKLPKGEYSIKFSRVGCITQDYPLHYDGVSLNIGDFIVDDAIILESATVSAERVLVKQEVNKLVYDVANDPDAKNSNTLKILEKIPFVSINKMSNKISVFGEEEGFAITINGRDNVMLSETNQYVAKMLEAGRLKEIELITNPEGRHNKKTAVINIVTTSSLPDGFLAEVNVSGSNAAVVSASAAVTSKIKKFIYNLEYGYRYYDLYGSLTTSETQPLITGEYAKMRQLSRSNPKSSQTHNATLNGSYDISPLNLITINLKAFIMDENIYSTNNSSYFDADNNLIREIKNVNNALLLLHNLSGDLNYQHFSEDNRKTLTVAYNIKNKSNVTQNDIITDCITLGQQSGTVIGNNMSSLEQTIGVDFLDKFASNQSYFVTAKYVNRHYGSESKFTDLDNLGYVQQVVSLLANYNVRGKKIMFTGELAYEYALNDINYLLTGNHLRKGYNGLNAKLNLSYTPTRKSTFTLTAYKVPFRPDITYLNPYEDKTIPGEITKGNPDLKSYDTYLGMLSYRFFYSRKFSFNTSIRYNFSNNSVRGYSYIDSDGNIINTFGNLSKEQFYLFNANFLYSPSRWLQLSLFTNLFYRIFELSEGTNSYLSYSINSTIRGDLWKGAHYEAFISYSEPPSGNIAGGAYAQRKQTHLFLQADFSLSQNIGKRLTAQITISNPWSKYRHNIFETATSDFTKYQDTQELGRTFSASITYNFGQFKEMVKGANRRIINKDTDRN